MIMAKSRCQLSFSKSQASIGEITLWLGHCRRFGRLFWLQLRNSPLTVYGINFLSLKDPPDLESPQTPTTWFNPRSGPRSPGTELL